MAGVGLDQRRLGSVAAVAVAVATWCAAAAGGVGVGGLDVPLAVLGAALAAGAAGALARRSPRVLPAGKDVLVLTAVTCAGFVGLYLAGWADQAHLVEVARLLPLAVVGLSVLWPEPNILRYCLLLGAGTLLGSAGGQAPPRAAVGGALAAMALAMVATNRLAAAAAPRLGGAAPARGRRVAGEAIAVLAIVGLLAALAASLLPPPPGQGGGPGDRPGTLPQPAASPLDAGEPFDVTAGRGEPGNGYVLLVSAPEADMWRTATYDHWDGAAWARSPERRADLDDGEVAGGLGDIDPDIDDPFLFQSVTLLARSANVLPAAARPTFAVSENEIRQAQDGSLFPVPALVRGGRYLVRSDRQDATAGALRAVPATAVPADVAGAYLQLPPVPPAVTALAETIAGGRRTTFDTVRAVESWIDDNTSVTDDATPVPAGADPLETFLFETRSGPPERAATAMVVMLRSLGVPARLAVGFLPGARAGPDRPFVVRSTDAHAWVEAWFPTVGWQRFDPTGRAPDPRAGAESVWDRLLRFLAKLWPLVALLALVAAGWLAWRGAAWWRRRAALPWATRFSARLERAGAARGRPRRPQETPAEYASGLAAGVLPDPRLEEVGELVTVAAWSRHEPAAEDKARAEEVLRAATKAAPVRRRWGRPTIPRS